jgi:hypothetical protein
MPPPNKPPNRNTIRGTAMPVPPLRSSRRSRLSGWLATLGGMSPMIFLIFDQ